MDHNIHSNMCRTCDKIYFYLNIINIKIKTIDFWLKLQQDVCMYITLTLVSYIFFKYLALENALHAIPKNAPLAVLLFNCYVCSRLRGRIYS